MLRLLEEDEIKPFNVLWKDKEIKIKKKRPFAIFQSYKLKQLIIKGGDDLRQEMIAM